ncbi:SWI/SNF family DNA-dependent ATPase Ris1, putative [Talaromyces stipitatus ATCC 10500]|uniref:SWI/SNF family DNA-dependent ATPase Ris1, putative n=1 Tax=Talaromyces stipitatus (strain ATCC 10500 / CBS 375.48 / QM 6759 / NRRL 1006) TaxID=441959 RepID=B8LZ36_TALSN|nr:SWI/SNF family DNA-dependent ATPase Ris1, putative [Talaromyces stipitatus ATCC 10500]EED21080.1 SWI/SNF family DNA-dependent ATPase Ris1, putative [Talaromyces stipitatus ATCC 10500]
MAASSPNMSIEHIIDDLDLHKALLESLLDTRPDDVEEREELQATIMDLERKLAQHRGIPLDAVSAQPSQVLSRGLSQYDGVGDSSPLGSGVSNNLRDDDFPVAYHETPHRKRYLDHSDIDRRSGSPHSKRARSHQSGSLTPSAASSHLGNSHSAGLDSLDDYFGFAEDGVDFREGQYEAEKWLEDRRAQELRDAEFARRLQQSLDEELSYVSSKPSQFSSHNAYSANAASPNKPVLNMQSTFMQKPNLPSSSAHKQPAFGSTGCGNPSYQYPSQVASSFNFPVQQPRPTPKASSTYQIIDSSEDEDLAEIGPNDFYGDDYPALHDNTSRTLMTMNPLKYGLEQLRGMKSALDYLPKDRPAMPWMINENDYLGGIPSYETETVDSKQANEELKALLESLRPDVELSKNPQGTPKELSFALFEHQKLGLAWMKAMEEGKNKGGILADDMGLGKTVQALSLIVSRPSTDLARKTTLIIAPVALMQQWKREIDRLVKPEHKLSVFILHGEKRKTTFDKLKKYDVVLTTFGSMGTELKKREQYDELRRFASQNSANMIAEARALPLLGPQSTWYRVIIDEAQCIKNRNTKSAIACCALNATYRWCMSGTPMMNGVHELHSLLRFLRIGPYNSLERFNKTFTRPLKTREGRNKALQQLRVVLKAILLRRTKFSKQDGKPLIDLPPRTTEKVHAVFSEDEQQLYNSLESRTQIQFNKYLDAGTVGRNYSNILVLLLRLRQACCHPHLINDLSVDVSAVTEQADFVENAKQFSPDVVRRLKENAPLECPVCIDAVENAIIFYPCGHATCAECFARISDPSLAVQQGVDGSVEAKCPNCRTKIDPKKVTDHVSFKEVHFPEESDGDEEKADVIADAEDSDDDDSDEEDDDDDDDDDSDLADFIVPGDYESEEDGILRKKTTDTESKPKKKPKGPKFSKGKGKSKGPKNPKKTLAVLRKEGQRNAAARRKYFKRLEKNWMTSAKIEKAIEILEEIKDSGSGEKTIIFSQFTSLLDLLEVPINRRGWKYRRYDGSMNPRDRNESVLEFTDNPECDIMLVSLKAGNAGLNLVAASQVIIFDPFWNPYIEEQAIDRAHRLGQTRPVQVHRVLVEKTVEDRILALQEEKREVIEGALDENAASQISRLGVRELKFLFNVQ